MTYTKIFKPSDIYREKPTVPAGYRVVDFREPKGGDIIIPLGLVDGVIRVDHTAHFQAPRLIIEPISSTPDWWE